MTITTLYKNSNNNKMHTYEYGYVWLITVPLKSAVVFIPSYCVFSIHNTKNIAFAFVFIGAATR